MQNLILMGCLFFLFLTNDLKKDDKDNHKSKVFNSVLAKTEEKLTNKYQLTCCGFGGGSKDGKFRNISLSFQRYGSILNINSSRKLILEIVEDFLEEVNSNEILKDYFNTFPLTEKNIEIKIHTFKEDRTDVIDPDIGFISLYRGVISYITMDEKLNFKTIIDENYKDALEK